jgi:hypothetical protein
MFYCPNNKNGTHQHALVAEARRCVAAAAYTPPAPVEPPITVRQLDYVAILKGDVTYAAKLTKTQASDYIERLKKGQNMSSPTQPVAPPPQPKTVDPRIAMLENLLPSFPTGYFAARLDESKPLTFIRVSRPASGKYKDTFKVQTQHSDLWHNRVVRWPNGRWWVGYAVMLDLLLVVCMSPKQAGLDYAREIGSCQICNKTLTDERSRHYGIGPDCETRHRTIIEYVDELNDGLSYETMRARSLV